MVVDRIFSDSVSGTNVYAVKDRGGLGVMIVRGTIYGEKKGGASGRAGWAGWFILTTWLLLRRLPQYCVLLQAHDNRHGGV